MSLVTGQLTSCVERRHRRPQRPLRWSVQIALAALVLTQSGCSWLRGGGAETRQGDVHFAAHETPAGDWDEMGEPGPQDQPAAKRRWLRLPALFGGKRNQRASARESRSAVDDPDAYVKLAEQAIGNHQWPAARRYVSRALELQPEHAQAWLLKGKLEETAGRQENAMKSYHRSVSCESLNPEARLRMARIQIEQGRAEHTAQALRSLIDCPLATADQKLRAKWLLGVAYVRAGRWSEAAAALEEGAQQRQLSSDDRYLLALARYKSGDFAGARREVEQQLQIQPGHAQFANLLAELNYVESTQSKVLPAQNLSEDVSDSGINRH